MLKFIVIGVALFIIYKLFTGDKKQKEIKEEQSKAQMAETGEMVKDPVCGTYVPTDSDIRVKQGDKVHCFCSYECRDEFLKKLESDQ